MSEKILMKGNDAIAEAAIRAGCQAYFGYPKTPQNEIPAYLNHQYLEWIFRQTYQIFRSKKWMTQCIYIWVISNYVMGGVPILWVPGAAK